MNGHSGSSTGTTDDGTSPNYTNEKMHTLYNAYQFRKG
jgi:hypothetical protein